MKIVFKNRFEINKKKLNKKSIEELYDVHCDLIISYNHYNDKGEIDKLESYIESRLEEEKEFAEAI